MISHIIFAVQKIGLVNAFIGINFRFLRFIIMKKIVLKAVKWYFTTTAEAYK